MAVCALPLIAAACAASPSGPARSGPASGPSHRPDLIGTSWVLDALGEKPLVEGSTVTAYVEPDGTVSGSGGCNRYRAKFQVEDATLRLTGPPVGTMMACPEPIMAQEAKYFAALERVRSFAVDGERLTLRDEASTPVLSFAAASSDLAGTAWSVIAFNDGSSVTTVLEGTHPTLSFGEDGNAFGSAGCNSFTGPFTLGEQSLGLGPLASTMMACSSPAGIMTQEQKLLAALESVTSYRLEADRLTLRAGERLAVELTRQRTK